MRIPFMLISILALSALVACDKGTDAAKPAAEVKEEKKVEEKPAEKPAEVAAADPAAEAKTIFDTRCVTCHGATGLGDGAAAAGLNPKPRSYADKAWQDSVKDEELAKAILEGGVAVGKSPLMPPNPDLKDKPAVVAEIVKIVRSFGAAAK